MLRIHIEDHSGISLGDDKAYLLENRLSALVFEIGCKSFGEFYLKLKHGADARALLDKAIDLISTNETLWFRDEHPFENLEKHVFPLLYEKIRSGGRSHIDIWSAACATGQEPYSIAMKAIEFFKQAGDDACNKRVRIVATDISGAAIATARAGIYDATAMKRGLPAPYRDAHFKAVNNRWAVSEAVKSLVTFKEYNLKHASHRDLGPFDVIFLRNVIIYFSDDFKKVVFEKIARRLKPGGFLFLGNGETVSGYSNAFDRLSENGLPFYKLRMI